MNLSSPTGNAAILDATGVGTINASDQEPQRQISINNVSVTEGGQWDDRSDIRGHARCALSESGDGRFRHRGRHGDRPW